MTKTERPSTGLKLALELLREYENEWDGGEQDPAVLAAATYIVCVKRDSDAWLYTADNWQEIVDSEAACLHAEHELEYVDAVYEVASGSRVECRTTTTVALRAPDGEVYYSFSPKPEPTWVLCIRHPDYGNDYETWPGLTPGVREVTIDTGADFSNGRPTRAWCAVRYFDVPDEAPAPFRRMVLDALKALCEGEEKHPRGVGTGW